VPVRINNDASTESAEVFNLTIQTASVTISSATAQVTIVDNDQQNDCNDISITYISNSIQVSGILLAPVLQVQIFDNTNPAQWLLVKDTFYNPGLTSASILNVTANKKYFVKVRRLQSNYTTEICSKEVELTASSLLQVSVRDTVIVEPLNGTPAVAKVYISIPVINNSTNITVNYTTINETAIGGAAGGTGIDYQTKSGVATILAGRRDTFILVNVYDDPITELIETFRVKLSSPSANAVIVDSIGVVSIINSDPCTIATMTTTYNSIQVSNFGTSATNFIIQVFDNSWNSVFNQTYTSNPGTVTIPSLLVNKTYYVKVQPYTAAWVPLCATEQYVTIFPTIAITATQSVGEGDGSVTLQICPSAPSSLPIKVKYQTISTGSATSGVDYVAKTDSIVIPALASCASISVTILDGNTLVEPSETFNVVLTNPVNALIASGTAVVTIIDNDGAQPNLKPTIINQPTTSGGQVSMRFRVENTTTTATGVASAVKIYKSTSLPYQTSHPVVYNGTIPSLVGLGKDSAWVFFIASSPGTYYYTVVVDPGNIITEANETDNAVTSNVNSALVSNPQVQTPTIQSLPEKEMVLFPNPVKDELHVFLADLAGVEIDAFVIDQYGRILRYVTGRFPHQLDITGLDFAPGLYYVRISSPSVRPRTLKFVVESGY
jgi:CARDB/Calx-beta domain